MRRFRGGLVFKAHGHWYHSTLGPRVVKKKGRVRQPRMVLVGGCNVIRCGVQHRLWGQFGGRIRSHELLEGALWLLDRAPLAILRVDFAL